MVDSCTREKSRKSTGTQGNSREPQEKLNETAGTQRTHRNSKKLKEDPMNLQELNGTKKNSKSYLMRKNSKELDGTQGHAAKFQGNSQKLQENQRNSIEFHRLQKNSRELQGTWMNSRN